MDFQEDSSRRRELSIRKRALVNTGDKQPLLNPEFAYKVPRFAFEAIVGVLFDKKVHKEMALYLKRRNYVLNHHISIEILRKRLARAGVEYSAHDSGDPDLERRLGLAAMERKLVQHGDELNCSGFEGLRTVFFP